MDESPYVFCQQGSPVKVPLYLCVRESINVRGIDDDVPGLTDGGLRMRLRALASAALGAFISHSTPSMKMSAD